MKQCSCCKLNKDETDYHKSRFTKDGLQHYCKECQCEVQRTRRLQAGMKPRAHTRKKHKCTFRFGFCIQCRNERNAEAFKKYGHPIICKSGRVAPQASFA